MTEADMIERERTELETNFKLLNVEVREVLSLKKGEGIQFENEAHTTVYIEGDNNLGDNCTKVIFWDGKSTSDPIVYKGLYLSTEYFSPKLLKKKLQSNYYTYFMSKLKEYKNKEEKITPRSKDISKAYVYNELMEWLYKGWLKDYQLIEMEFKGVKSIVVKENGKNVVFLREIVKGGADKSYGIEVARLSGVPKDVLNRSRKILKKLENRKNLIESKMKAEQMMLFGNNFEEEEEIETELINENEIKVLEMLKVMDLNSLSPLESLLKLSELKKILLGGNND